VYCVTDEYVVIFYLFYNEIQLSIFLSREAEGLARRSLGSGLGFECCAKSSKHRAWKIRRVSYIDMYKASSYVQIRRGFFYVERIFEKYKK
jgi:hypothetical protein